MKKRTYNATSVGMTESCTKCSNKRIWLLKDGRFRCSTCRYTSRDQRVRIKINKSQARKVVREFILGHPTNVIIDRVDVSKYMFLKILTLLRTQMTKDAPNVFEDIV